MKVINIVFLQNRSPFFFKFCPIVLPREKAANNRNLRARKFSGWVVNTRLISVSDNCHGKLPVRTPVHSSNGRSSKNLGTGGQHHLLTSVATSHTVMISFSLVT